MAQEPSLLNKHSSLFRTLANYGRKGFIKLGLGDKT
jgi:hypothetical protein